MKKFLLVLLLTTSTLVADNDIFSFLIPHNTGTLGNLGHNRAETEVVNIMYAPQGMVIYYSLTSPRYKLNFRSTEGLMHQGYYTDGVIVTVLSTSKDKKIGYQHVFMRGKEVSCSKQFYMDPDQSDVVVHVHKKFLVYTGKEKQLVIPRGK